MPQLEAEIRVEKQEEVVPGEFALTVVFTNRGGTPVLLNTHQAEHPALVLDLRDASDRPVPLPPPSAPDALDLAPGEPIAPGASVSLTYVGFLDRGLPPGQYRVRYFGEFPALGGSRDDPLRSDWQTFTVRAQRDLPPGLQIPGLKPNPEGPEEKPLLPLPRLLGPVWLYVVQIWCWVWCLLRRWVFLRRCDRVLQQEIDEARSETISNAPPGSEAWNGNYGWHARFLLIADEPNCRVTARVRVRLVGTITAAQRTAWETAIEAAWNNRFKLCCDCCCCPSGLDLVGDVQFVSSGEHQVVNVGTSTTNMSHWGATDTVDISHEFGHMLGALDEYFTVNGVNYGAGRQPGGAIMNNPANPPAARHYDLLRAGAVALLGHSCSTVSMGTRC